MIWVWCREGQGSGLETSPFAPWVFSCLSVFEVGHICIFKINRCLSNTWAGGLELSVGPETVHQPGSKAGRENKRENTPGTCAHVSCVQNIMPAIKGLCEVWGCRERARWGSGQKYPLSVSFFGREGNHFECQLGEKRHALLCFYYWLMLIIGPYHRKTHSFKHQRILKMYFFNQKNNWAPISVQIHGVF